MATIAHLTSVHPAFDTRIFYKECRTLAQAGHEVVLIVPHERDQVVDGIRIQAVPMAGKRWTRMTITAWKVFRAGLAVDADVYHFHDPELLPWAILLHLWRKRVVYDMHEDLPKQVRTKPWVAPVVRRPLAMLANGMEFVLLKWMRIIYAEDSYATSRKWNSCFTTILNMPKIDHFRGICEAKHSIPAVGYIGGVTLERGSVVTLEALRILKERGHRLLWECVGPVSESHRMALEELGKTGQLEGINLRGRMSPEHGWRIMARCHIGLALLKPIPNYLESLPTKMFEYMALGLPVVVSDFALYREIVDEVRCGICVDPEDPQAAADAMQWILEHPAEAQTMGRRGQKAVQERYNWDAEAKKLLTFYEHLLE